MSWDWILWAIVAVFWGWEAFAHYALHNRTGHTLSNRIVWFERTTGWPGHVLTGLVLLLLFFHFHVL